jgi:hypothetical protein
MFKINDYLSCLFMYRFKRLQNLPEFFNGYFTQNNEVHHYNTRNANKFHVRACSYDPAYWDVWLTDDLAA